MEHGQKDDYQLRYAAGLYWLLDMKQEGEIYRRPLSLNETGALIWKRHRQGESPRRIARFLAEEYEVPEQETYSDVERFLQMLAERGITGI